MIAGRLRKAIIQTAIEGKLTNRVLDKEIKVSIPNKFLNKKPNIRKENLFDIPNNWGWVCLEEISEIISKGTTPTGGKSSYVKKGIPFIRAENIGDNGNINYKNIVYITPEVHNSLKRSQLQKNDILICIAGTLGRSAVLDDGYNEINTNQAVAFIRLKYTDDLVDVRFIQRCISADKIQKELLSKTKITAIPNLTLKIIRNTWIPLPPLIEQKRIVEKLDELMPMIDELEKYELELRDVEDEFPEKIKKAVLKSAICGELTHRNKEDEEINIRISKIKKHKKTLVNSGEIRIERNIEKIKSDDEKDLPVSWGLLKLTDLVHFVKTKQIDSVSKMAYLDVTTLRTKIFNKFRTKGTLVKKGDYAILVDGHNSGELFEMISDGFLGSTLRKVVFNKEIDKNYIKYVLEYSKTILIENKRGSAIPHLDFRLFNNINVPIPPIEEQQRIVKKLEQIFNQINNICL